MLVTSSSRNEHGKCNFRDSRDSRKQIFEQIIEYLYMHWEITLTIVLFMKM